MNYCTIQEAYNIPSFAKKKKQLAPLSSQIQCAGSGSVVPNASAQPYDPFSGENSGKEQAALVEGFTSCGSGASPLKSGAGGPQCGRLSPEVDNAANNIPYTTQANDYDYYCKTYNVCPQPKMKITEKFANPQQQPQQQQQQQQQQQGSCSSIQAPIYQLPISDANKKAYDSALKVAMDDTSAANVSTKMPIRTVDMSGVAGLYDDEIDQYMHVNDMKETPMPAPKQHVQKGPAPAAFDNSDSTPFSKAMANFSQARNRQGGRPILRYEEPSPIDKWQYFMDLFLFIASGVLIILLCDMLFRIALSIGMKDTFTMMEPYLKELAELKAKIAEVAGEAA
jgi:hypothetical protein